MERFILLVQRKYNKVSEVVEEEVIGERVAEREAMRLFRDFGLQRVAVVDSNLKVVFEMKRRCRCVNVQFMLRDNGEIEPRCSDCGLVVNNEGICIRIREIEE